MSASKNKLIYLNMEIDSIDRVTPRIKWSLIMYFDGEKKFVI